MTLSPRTRVGPYEIVGDLGVGGMGEVYRARDTRLNRDVALKVLPQMFAADPDRMARFEREAQLLASLNHPHIAALYGLEESGSTRALVMELIEGPTLADRIVAGRIPLDEALTIAKQIAEALEFAHDHTVIHRDLKPANIKVTPDGSVKVLDFGLAKALDEHVASGDPRNSPTITMGSPSTRLGVILGTAAYMSPEQAKGKPVDRRCDIWSFGVVLFEMLTGKLLFDGETAAETMASVMKEAPGLDRLPAGTPDAIRKLIQRCLEKDPRRRLQHIGEARIAIDDVLSGAVHEETPPSPPRRTASRLPWAAAGVLLLSLAVLGFVHFRETPARQSSIRFDIPAPEKSIASMFRLSPDGRYLAIVAGEGGQTRLWVRPLDSNEAQALPGTDGASYPFWSTDSAFLAFFSDGKLKKIAVAGGPPQTLCDAPNGRGGTWNREGSIIFSPNISGGLYKTASSGGIATPLTKVESGAGNNHRSPEFLPDGRHFLYLAINDNPETTGIHVGSLDGTPPVRLLADASNAAYAPPVPPDKSGHLVFARQGTLMAQPFDPSGPRMTGEMFPIAERVGTAGNVGFFAFSLSENGALAYRTGGRRVDQELVWKDRTGKRLGVLTPPAAITSATLSPDEKRIAVALILAGQMSGDIWLQDLARGAMSRFTFGPGRNQAPVWSPDGNTLAYVSRPTPLVYELHQKAASGAGKEELLARVGVNSYVSDWSADGKYLVYSEYNEKTNDDLWLLPLNGDHKPLAYLQNPFSESMGAFSPDGRWMAYMSNESGTQQVYVQSIPTTGAKWQVSTAGGSQPRWRRDGKELFYVASDRKLMAVPVKGGGTFEAGSPQPLFEGVGASPAGQAPTHFYQPTADGQRFMMTVPSGGETASPPISIVVNWLAGVKK